MSLPTTQQLDQLAKADPQIAISAYIPLDNDSPDAVKANQIRVKNLISDLTDVLKDHKSKIDGDVSELLKPLTQIEAEPDQLWKRKMRSMAVFVDESQLQYYFLPMPLAEPIFQIQESFYLEPLVAAADDAQTYYALSISHNHVQLFKFNPYDIEPVTVSGLPSGGMEEVLNIDEYPDSHQFHGESPRASRDDGKSGDTGQHHSHHEANDVDKDMLKQYFRQLDDPLTTYLQKTEAPVVFAGVEWLFPIFNEETSIRNLHKEPLTGNFEKTNVNDLHKKLIDLLNISPD
jgi:hypothetical protein